jgi:hypothetical protein
VYAVKDANFDMDIDPNFSEATQIFYEKLGYDREKVQFLKRPGQEQDNQHNDSQSSGDDDDKLIDGL